MFNKATFGEIPIPSSGNIIIYDDGKSISRNVASLNKLVHDVLNLLWFFMKFFMKFVVCSRQMKTIQTIKITIIF